MKAYRHGFTPKGTPRYTCAKCPLWFTDPEHLIALRRLAAIALIKRGVGLRQIERETGMHRDTVMRLRRKLRAQDEKRTA